MAEKSPLPRLDDILRAINGIEMTVGGLNAETCEDVWHIKHSIERGIEIISEASRHIPDELKSGYVDIPWGKVAGVGNVLRHEYDEIAWDTLWAIVKDELPKLKIAVAAMIEALERASE